MDSAEFLAKLQSRIGEKPKTLSESLAQLNTVCRDIDWHHGAGNWYVLGNPLHPVLVRDCRLSLCGAEYTSRSTDVSSATGQVKDVYKTLRLWQRKDIPKHIIVLAGVTEPVHPEVIVPVIQQHCAELHTLQDAGIISNYTVIASYNNTQENCSSIRNIPNTILVPWFLLEYSDLYPEPIPEQTKPGKILFTPGKIQGTNAHFKVDRLATLFYLAGSSRAREKFLWSFGGTRLLNSATTAHSITKLQHIAQWVHPNLFDEQHAAQVLDTLARDLDSHTAGTWRCHREHCQTYPISHSVYSQTGVEYVHESYHWCQEHITEKLFRPILAGKPFVTSFRGHSDWLERIDSRFAGFTDLLPLPVSRNHALNAPEEHTSQLDERTVDLLTRWRENTTRVEQLWNMRDSIQVRERVDQNVRVAHNIISRFSDNLTRRHPPLKHRISELGTILIRQMYTSFSQPPQHTVEKLTAKTPLKTVSYSHR